VSLVDGADLLVLRAGQAAARKRARYERVQNTPSIRVHDFLRVSTEDVFPLDRQTVAGIDSRVIGHRRAVCRSQVRIVELPECLEEMHDGRGDKA
jgi:hypothetical protein